MDTATPQLRRLVRLALIGLGTAFAWIVIATLLGINAGQARADDATDDNGLLGAVTSLVDRTVSGVTGTVTAVTGGATDTVNTVVSVAPAPVQQPVREVVQTVGTVVTTVTEPVSDVVSGGVVGGITAPVVDVVTEVPIVGGIVTGIGADEAIADLSDTVDGTLDALVGAVEGTGASVGQPPTSPAPVDPELPGGTVDEDGESGLHAAVAGLQAASPDAAAVRSVKAFGVAVHAVAPPAGGDVAVTGGTSIFSTLPLGGTPAAGLCPPAASSTGPGGAGSGAWALAALLPLAAHRAWVRRAGADDDDLPAAPVGSTDVSPD